MPSADASPACPIQVVCAGWEHCAPDYEIDRIEFPYQSVELVISGRGSVELNGHTHELRPGTAFAYGPDTPHRIRSDASSPLSKYFVDFTGPGSERLLQQFDLPAGTAITLKQLEEPRSVFDQLLRIGQQSGPHTGRMTYLVLELLLHALTHARAEDDCSNLRREETFRRCRDYVDANFLTLNSVDEIAQSCFVHRSHLCRLFREFEGISPLQYLQQRRMEWAAEQLLNTGALVREVADALNTDPFQLSRTFKRVLGLAPTELIRDRTHPTIRCA